MCSLGLDSHILGEGITLVQVILHAHPWSIKLWHEIILTKLSKRPFKTTKHILFENKTTHQKEK